MTTTAVKFLLIDQWVEGEARASPKTFSRKELEFRAREHNYGNGHEILPGDVNKELARKILEFADAHPDLLADEPCPH
jgi:hypothetical protein